MCDGQGPTLTLGPRALQRAAGHAWAAVLGQCAGRQAAGRAVGRGRVALEPLRQRAALVLLVLLTVGVQLLVAVGASTQRLQGGRGAAARGRGRGVVLPET